MPRPLPTLLLCFCPSFQPPRTLLGNHIKLREVFWICHSLCGEHWAYRDRCLNYIESQVPLPGCLLVWKMHVLWAGGLILFTCSSSEFLACNKLNSHLFSLWMNEMSLLFSLCATFFSHPVDLHTSLVSWQGCPTRSLWAAWGPGWLRMRPNRKS